MCGSVSLRDWGSVALTALSIRSRAALQLRQQQLFWFWYQMSCQYSSTWAERWVTSSYSVNSVQPRKRVVGELKTAEKVQTSMSGFYSRMNHLPLRSILSTGASNDWTPFAPEAGKRELANTQTDSANGSTAVNVWAAGLRKDGDGSAGIHVCLWLKGVDWCLLLFISSTFGVE